MDSHGGWLASAVELARFAAALDGKAPEGFLTPGSARLLYEPPASPIGRKPNGLLSDHYYGLGWEVRPVANQGKANYWHTGSLPGTFTQLVRRFDGVSWIVLFNQRSEDTNFPDSSIDSALHHAADRVAGWPSRDLF
jgi:hypothetical protein